MHPHTILWDWDNTLVDAWGGIHAALNDAFHAHDLPAWTLAETKQRVRGGMQESFQALFGARWQAAASLFRQRHAAHQLAALRPMPGVPDLLRAAEPRRQAVVSNKEFVPLCREVAHLGWETFFATLVGADTAEAPKPHPAPIWHALAAIGVKPGRDVWYVGDTATDMLAAHAAGCTAVLLGDASHDGGLSRLAECGATPHLHFVTTDALAARLRMPATG